jgi:hypothetical protein
VPGGSHREMAPIKKRRGTFVPRRSLLTFLKKPEAYFNNTKVPTFTSFRFAPFTITRYMYEPEVSELALS